LRPPVFGPLVSELPGPHRRAVLALAEGLADADVDLALTGSASFALQGVPVEPDDVDVQTTEAGAYAIEAAFTERVVDPVEFTEAEEIRSHFGVLELEGVRVEVMGDVQRQRADGWSEPTNVVANRESVTLEGRRIPVLSLAYEARAYAELGRDERAALLREYVE
jgi:hypothetical protein